MPGAPGSTLRIPRVEHLSFRYQAEVYKGLKTLLLNDDGLKPKSSRKYKRRKGKKREKKKLDK